MQAKHNALKQIRIRELEEQDRRGYAAQPFNGDEILDWESETVWPDK